MRKLEAERFRSNDFAGARAPQHQQISVTCDQDLRLTRLGQNQKCQVGKIAAVRDIRRRMGYAHHFGEGQVVGQQLGLFLGIKPELWVGQNTYQFLYRGCADQRDALVSLPSRTDEGC